MDVLNKRGAETFVRRCGYHTTSQHFTRGTHSSPGATPQSYIVYAHGSRPTAVHHWWQPPASRCYQTFAGIVLIVCRQEVGRRWRRQKFQYLIKLASCRILEVLHTPPVHSMHFHECLVEERWLVHVQSMNDEPSTKGGR